MAAKVTAGREKYAEHEVLMNDTLSRANSLREAFIAAVDADAESYTAVGAVYSMPKSSPEEKTARKQAMREALLSAAAVPLSVMELSRQALILTKGIVGKSNPNISSDLGVAALCLRTAICGAWLNVRTNLNGMNDDRAIEYLKKGEALIAEALTLADEIYNEILAAVGGQQP